MAKHQVTFELRDCELGNADIRFRVRRGGAVLGTALVSKGAIVWRPKWQPGRGTGGKKLRWIAFDEVMCEYGRPERRRKRGTT